MSSTAQSVLHSDQAALELLLEASSALLAARELESVLPKLLRVAGELVAPDAHALWRYNGAAGEWRVLASANLSGQYPDGARIATAAAGALGPLFSEDVGQHPP